MLQHPQSEAVDANSCPNTKHGLRVFAATKRRRARMRRKSNTIRSSDFVKFNPIADWTSEDVWNYIRANNVYLQSAARSATIQASAASIARVRLCLAKIRVRDVGRDKRRRNAVCINNRHNAIGHLEGAISIMSAIKPHGGVLINRVATGAEREALLLEAAGLHPIHSQYMDDFGFGFDRRRRIFAAYRIYERSGLPLGRERCVLRTDGMEHSDYIGGRRSESSELSVGQHAALVGEKTASSMPSSRSRASIPSTRSMKRSSIQDG